LNDGGCLLISSPEAEIKIQLISGSASAKVTEKGLSEPNLTMDELLQFMKTLELSNDQALKVRNGRSKAAAAEDTNAASTPTDAAAVNAVHRNGQFRRRPQPRTHPQRKQTPQTCRNCGNAWPHQGGQGNCPARGAVCSHCHKLGHYERTCLSKNDRRVNCLENDYEEDHYESVYSIKSTQQGQRGSLPFRTVDINNHSIRALVDTGSSVNTINEATWHAIGSPKLTLAASTLKPYGPDYKPVPVLGIFTAVISYGPRSCQATVHGIQGHAECLLGHTTVVDLHIATIHALTEQPIRESPETTYPTLFNGIGHLKDFTVTLHVDESIKPSAMAHRRVPFHLRQKVEEKIQELLNLDIIEPAEGPTPWISPIVTPPKPGNPSEIRLCVDMRGPNKAIKRERHVTPTIEEVLSDLNGAAHFSKLDLNQGYHQLLLAPESRYITTFSTHIGLFRYKRLNFGISCAAEIFQNAISKVLNGIPGTINVSDDILIYAATKEEHDDRLHQVLCRLQEKGMTLNRKKCLFAVPSLVYLGFKFSAAGVSPDPGKVRDIKECVPPSNPTEMRSLLGLANYCARFIPNFATMTSPLRELTRKNVTWEWTPRHAEVLKNLKESLTSEAVMDYFDPAKKSHVIVDASPVGVAAMLTQPDESGPHIIAYASRALTAVEQRYSQMEREALAVVFGCERFHLYLAGTEFTIITDHKPLEPMFNNPFTALPARIERWVLRLQQYHMNVEYSPGKDNPADYASRHPTSIEIPERTQLMNSVYNVRYAEKIAEEYVNQVAAESTPRSMKTTDIKSATDKDATLQTVIAAVRSGNWSHAPTPFQVIISMN
jgi:hypothetical protein